jgi:4-amino-4-deoxy-L-arabinose transferase-like glycosyltransferase
LIGALCSIIINGIFNIQPLLSLRLIFRFYFFYLALINLGIDNSDLKRINNFLFSLFIIQLPVTAIKFYFFGFTEETIGTYGTKGGGLTPIIPIIALAYLAGYYVFHKAKKLYILLALGFILLGIAGVKAALFFLYPATFIGIYYLLFIRERRIKFYKNMVMFILVVLVSVGAAAAIISVSARLNPEKAIGGGSINFSYAAKKIKEYTLAKSDDKKYGSGRFATTMIAFDTSLKGGFGTFILGYGPGSITESSITVGRRIDSRLIRVERSYGVSGMVYVLIEYGMFGVIVLSLILLIFIRLSWKWYNNETEHYWKAFSLGTFVFSLLYAFIFFTYNRTFIDDTISPVYFYAMAILYLRFKVTLQEKVKRSTE